MIQEVVSFFFPDPKAKLGELKVDAFIKETHTFSSSMSEHPMESGGNIVDHVHQQPFSLSIEGVISNTPMSLVGLTAVDSVRRYAMGDSNDFAAIAFEKIEEIFKKRLPISIVTSLKTYHKMVLESLSVERGGSSMASLKFSCTAKQIHLAEQKLIDLPKPERAKPKEKNGLQETKPIAEGKAAEIKKKSGLFSLLIG